MKLYELTDEIRVKVHLHNEEKELLKKLRAGTPKHKLTEREKHVILHSLKIKGLVDE